MSNYIGDFAPDEIVKFFFTTNTSAGAASTPTTAGTITVYKEDEGAATTKTSAETYITYTTAFNTVAGLNAVEIDTSQDAFFVPFKEYIVVLSGATVDGTASVISVVGSFSIGNRSGYTNRGNLAAVTDGTTMTLNAGAVGTADYYVGQYLEIVDGTGKGQVSLITANTAAKVVTVQGFATAPDTSSHYRIVPTGIDPMTADEVNADIKVFKKNTAISNFAFEMYTTTGAISSGETITAERLLDGGTWTTMSNAASEVGTTGTYRIAIAAADINGDVVTWRFTGNSANQRPTYIKVYTTDE